MITLVSFRCPLCRAVLRAEQNAIVWHFMCPKRVPGRAAPRYIAEEEA